MWNETCDRCEEPAEFWGGLYSPLAIYNKNGDEERLRVSAIGQLWTHAVRLFKCPWRNYPVVHRVGGTIEVMFYQAIPLCRDHYLENTLGLWKIKTETEDARKTTVYVEDSVYFAKRRPEIQLTWGERQWGEFDDEE